MGSSDHSSECSVPVEGEKVIDELSYYHLLKNNSALWEWLKNYLIHAAYTQHQSQQA
jgi:hypothetical protein